MLTRHAVELQLVAHGLLLWLERQLLLFMLAVHPDDLGVASITDAILMCLLLDITQAQLWVISCEDRLPLLLLLLATVNLHLTTDNLLSLVGKLDGTTCEWRAVSLRGWCTGHEWLLLEQWT